MHIEMTLKKDLILDTIHTEMTSEVIEIVIRSDSKVIWINADGSCIYRISKIEGKVHVDDRRNEQEKKET